MLIIILVWTTRGWKLVLEMHNSLLLLEIDREALQCSFRNLATGKLRWMVDNTEKSSVMICYHLFPIPPEFLIIFLMQPLQSCMPVNTLFQYDLHIHKHAHLGGTKGTNGQIWHLGSLTICVSLSEMVYMMVSLSKTMHSQDIVRQAFAWRGNIFHWSLWGNF